MTPPLDLDALAREVCEKLFHTKNQHYEDDHYLQPKCGVCPVILSALRKVEEHGKQVAQQAWEQATNEALNSEWGKRDAAVEQAKAAERERCARIANGSNFIDGSRGTIEGQIAAAIRRGEE